ncbi:MAG: hypothetical protein EON55_02615, partial [Alphaproteobacteria bacterium]
KLAPELFDDSPQPGATRADQASDAGNGFLYGRGGDVALPSHPDQGGAAAIQEAVAGIAGLVGPCGPRLRRVVEQFRRQLAAAVRHVEQHGAAGRRWVGWSEDDDVGGGFDFAVRSARRQSEICDDGVVRVGGIERDLGPGGDPAICAGVAEAAAGKGGHVLGHVETRNLG